MRSLRSHRARAGRVLGGLLLLAALPACPGGEVAADTEGTAAASGSGDPTSGCSMA